MLAGHAGRPRRRPEGNLLLDEIFGARIRWAGDADDTRLAAVADEAAAELALSGAHPAVIPFGGSNRDGALAYADAARELPYQLRDQLGAGSPRRAGDLGRRRRLGRHHGGSCRRARTRARARRAHRRRRRPGRSGRRPRLRDHRRAVDPQTLRLRTDQVGAGYGRLTEPTAAAIRLAARTEGIVLDPTYTGRAMAGLIAAAADGDLGQDAPVVFWHTGGLPGLFGHPDAATIATARSRRSPETEAR